MVSKPSSSASPLGGRTAGARSGLVRVGDLERGLGQGKGAGSGLDQGRRYWEFACWIGWGELPLGDLE
jgi:hypothetical protein